LLAAVTIFLHIPIADWHAEGPLLAGYERMFHRLGPTHESIGPGSWIDPRGKLEVETDVHVIIRTTPQRAAAFVPAFLRELCRDLRQQETLAEVVGTPISGGRSAKQVVVTRPFDVAAAELVELHILFDGFAGGASEYDDAAGISIEASLPAGAVPQLRATLQREGYRPLVRDVTLVEQRCS
jgi:hypothetical protein